MDYEDEESALNGGQPVASSSTSIAGPSETSENSEGGPSMSKKAMKRAAKQARIQELKPQRRAAEKARRKERAAATREAYAAGTLREEEKAVYEKKKELRASRKHDKGESASDWGGGVIIDLGFDDLMTDNEITSMASQIGYVYSANRTSARPFSTVLYTSFGPTPSSRLWQKMSTNGWNRWTRSYWWEQGVGEVVTTLKNGHTGAAPTPSSADINFPQTADGEMPRQSDLMDKLTGPNLPPRIEPGRHQVVYLSADADEELATLSEDEIYVIGGIVDRNRHKMLCQDKAVKLGIRTARLPIGTYLANLPTRKVLTVNQVFEILAQYVVQQDWAKAFDTVIPQRKYHAVGKQAQRRGHKRQAEGSEGAEMGEGMEQRRIGVDEGSGDALSVRNDGANAGDDGMETDGDEEEMLNSTTP